MQCLHCGGCCKTMSPISAPFPCPALIQCGEIYLCRDYEHSPQLCQNFDFEDFRYCPYGLNELQLSETKDRGIIEDRVKRGARLIEKVHQKQRQRE